MTDYFMGVDVGSVSTNVAVLDSNLRLVHKLYIRTMGHPIEATKRAIKETGEKLPTDAVIRSVGTTGSARNLTKVMLGADIAKTEITAHAVASSFFMPDVRTILEIGGQDSKVIVMEDGLITDFGMNTVCAAGTGSFLDHQARRLGIEIEDFGDIALKSTAELNIAGRCTVFAESDMIHKQQTGHPMSEILRGLCDALVRNYINNICKGKLLLPPVMFQGGVAANAGMVRAFRELINAGDGDLIIPEYHASMGAIGAALSMREQKEIPGLIT